MLKDLRCLCLVVFAVLLSGTASAQPSQVFSYDALSKNLRTQCSNLSIGECTSTSSCTWGPTAAGTNACIDNFTAYLQVPTGSTNADEPSRNPVKIEIIKLKASEAEL